MQDSELNCTLMLKFILLNKQKTVDQYQDLTSKYIDIYSRSIQTNKNTVLGTRHTNACE